MKTLLLLFLSLGTHALAENFRFAGGDGWVAMRVPDSWEHDNLDRTWYSGFTPDRTVWVSASSFDWLTDARLKTWLPKHLGSFGVEVQLDWATFHSSRGRLGEWAVTDYFVTGETEDGRCEVTVCVFELDERARFLVTTGGPAAQREKYRAALRGILESVERTTAPTLPAR